MARPNKPWFRHSTGWWMVSLNGRQVKLARGIDAREEAFAAFQTRLRSVGESETPTLKVSELVERHLVWSRKHNAPRCFAEKNRILNQFSSEFGHRDAISLRVHDVEDWVDRHDEWRSDNTRGSVKKWVKRLYSFAAKQGLILHNPISGVSCERGGTRRPLTRNECARLLWASRSGKKTGEVASSGRRFAEFMRVLWATGARPGELTRAKWSDVDFEHKTIVLKEHKTAKKTGKPRLIIIPPGAMRVLRRIRDRNEHENVFVTWKLQPWGRMGFAQRFSRLRKKAGLPSDATPYGCRHAYGTQAVRSGVDLITLSRLMGHESIRMTEKYTHLAGDLEHLRNAANQIHHRKR